MPLKTILVESKTGKDAEIIDDIFGQPSIAITDHYVRSTRFKSETRTSKGISTITSPKKDGAILLTDMIISCDRVAGSEIIVSFDDETRGVTIYDGYANDAPINFSANFHGGWTGWKDASLQLTTISSVKATLSVGYIKIPNGLEYKEWDALR